MDTDLRNILFWPCFGAVLLLGVAVFRLVDRQARAYVQRTERPGDESIAQIDNLAGQTVRWTQKPGGGIFQPQVFHLKAGKTLVARFWISANALLEMDTTEGRWPCKPGRAFSRDLLHFNRPGDASAGDVLGCTLDGYYAGYLRAIQYSNGRVYTFAHISESEQTGIVEVFELVNERREGLIRFDRRNGTADVLAAAGVEPQELVLIGCYAGFCKFGYGVDDDGDLGP